MSPRPFRSFLSALLLTAPLLAQGEVDLRTTATKGGSVWLVIEMKQEQSIEAAGQSFDSTNVTTRTVHLTVKDVDDKGNLIVETKVVRAHGTLSIPMMGDAEFDSANGDTGDEQDGMVGGMVKSMLAPVGKSFTAKVSTLGKVVELMDDAKELTKATDGPGAIEADQLKSMVEGAFGDLPEKPTAVGAKWSNNETVTNSRMPVQTKLEMTLAKVEADTFEITAAGTVEKPEAKDAGSDEADDEMAAMMKSVVMSNGKLVGSLKVSRRDGFVLESTTTTTMDIEMGGGQMNMSMKMIQSTKRTTEADAVPKKAEKKAEPAKAAEGK
jgi:hypothetical protein